MQELQKIKFSFMENIAEPTLKEKIHFAISDIDDEKYLEAIYYILTCHIKHKEEVNKKN